jgi:hypothetical protein
MPVESPEANDCEMNVQLVRALGSAGVRTGGAGYGTLSHQSNNEVHDERLAVQHIDVG